MSTTLANQEVRANPKQAETAVEGQISMDIVADVFVLNEATCQVSE